MSLNSSSCFPAASGEGVHRLDALRRTIWHEFLGVKDSCFLVFLLAAFVDLQTGQRSYRLSGLRPRPGRPGRCLVWMHAFAYRFVVAVTSRPKVGVHGFAGAFRITPLDGFKDGGVFLK
jgi:hypothetical protein